MVSSVWSIGRKLSPYILLLGLFVTALFLTNSSTHAVAGVNQQLNFQGRLLNSQGATVPDGYYNIQFKIYQDGDGQTAGNTTGSPAGSLKWTENYLNNNSQGVAVVNGFMSVQLGSITPFGSNIDWNQDTLWLSMNIGSTNTTCTPFSSCTPDGEMIPMKRLSANAYALNSALLGGLSSADFLQFGQGGFQTDSSNNTSVAINKTGNGNIIELQSSGNAAFTINNSGDLAFGSNADHTIAVAAAASGAGKALAVSAGDAASGSTLVGGDLVLQGGAGDGVAESGSVIVKSNTTNSTTAFQVQNASSSALLTVDTANDVVQIGSSTPNTNPNLLVLNSYSDSSDPTTGTNGAMYYNTTMKIFRCYNDGAWVNCAKAGGIGGSGTSNKVAFFNNSGNLATNNQFAWDDSAGALNVGLSSTASFVIGDTGPAGGTIFYDKGDNSGGWRYLEAAPADASSASPWGCDGVNITTGNNIGDGAQNTVNMMAAGCESSNDAGKVASDYAHSGYDDWFLPSIQELSEMYDNRSALLMSTSDTWWTSTATGSTTASRWKFSSGSPSNAGKTYSYNVRPIRKVSSVASSGLYVDTATNRIGIGTVNPAYKLDIDGTAGITGNLSVFGQATIKESSTTALQVQNATGTSVLGVDTDNGVVQVGSATANNNPSLLVLNNYSDSSDPTTGTNGAMYYNTTMKIFRCYNDGAWVNCAKAGGLGGTGDANKVAFFNSSGNVQTNNQFSWDDSAATLTVGSPSATGYSIGDTGPAGGIIFYDKGNNSGGWRYLEASPTTQSYSTQWGCYGSDITGATDTSVGSGDQNTTNIIAAGCAGSNTAPVIVSNYSLNSYNDWFLPSKDGLNFMYQANSTLGNMTGRYYSSSQTTATNVWTEQMDNGVQLASPKNNPYRARAVRKVAGISDAGLYVNTSNSRIGVGTLNPQYKLDVASGTGVVAQFSGRVIGGDAVSNNEFITLGQANTAYQAAGNYIDLQSITPGTAQTGNFNISGSGIADTLQGATSVLTPLLDTATATSLSIGTSNATNIQIGSTTLSSGTQNINIGNNNTSGGTTNITIGSDALATAGTTAIQAKTSISLSTDGIARGTLDNAGNLYLGNGVSATSPSNFTISGTGSSVSAVAGGSITIQGGNATTGNANGGNLTLSGGGGSGSGSDGLVVLTTPTFSTTTNDSNCYTGGALVANSCTIAVSSVNSSAAIFAGLSTSGKTVTLPDPTIKTAGRIIYLTAANGSQDFTLLVNGGGTGNSIAMRQNTTAAMIWNGSDWTAAGASSSTTLQSAYDNTLQSAGGAELVVSHTANTNGLTIRDSSVDPVNGTLLSVQTASAAVLLSVNSNVTEYSTNGGAEVAGGSSGTFPASTWSSVGSSTVSRHTAAGDYVATGKAAVSVVTSASAGAGVKNTLSTALTANTNYNVSFATRLASGALTDMDVYYSANGSATSVLCKSDQAVATSIWTKVNCTFSAPASGINSSNAILIRQTSGAAHTFYVDNLSVTIAADYNYATDGSVSDNINFASNWSAVSGASVSRTTSYGNDASDSAHVVTSGAGQGVRNKLAINPLADTLYRVSVYVASTTSGFNNFTVQYSRNGGANFVNCADYNTQTVSSSVSDFTQVTCYITTDGTAATNPYIYFTQTDSTGRTFYVDTLSVTLSSKTTPNVQIGGGATGGPVTLLTLDKGASAPIASNNDALLGSMYYDTTLGKLQCYEADGWGACGSSPDNIVTISPEYNNAVLHGTGVGTMTSDICSDALNINDGSSGQDTICGPNETFNFYKWTSPQATNQSYSIYVTYQLPGTFKSFASGQTSIMGRTNSANSSVDYQIYRNDSNTGLSPCGAAVSVSSGAVSSWQTGVASGTADPSTCGFTPGNSIVIKITLTAKSNANAYISNLNFIYSNR